MKLIQKIDCNIPFLLHDSRIKKIKMTDDSLSFYLDYVYEFKEDSEIFYPACMSFKDVDLEECKVLVFDKDLRNGSFAGSQYNIKEYVKKFADAEFEIVTDAYNGYDTIFQGFMYREEKERVTCVTCIFNIYNTGGIEFDIK